LPGSKVMRQRDVETLITEEPDALIAHVRVCGGAGRATAGSTRSGTAARLRMGMNVKGLVRAAARDGQR
jgi:hypothetical protein